MNSFKQKRVEWLEENITGKYNCIKCGGYTGNIALSNGLDVYIYMLYIGLFITFPIPLARNLWLRHLYENSFNVYTPRLSNNHQFCTYPVK